MAAHIRFIFRAIGAFSRKFPIVRGMVAYGVLWPTSSYIQQRIEGQTFSTIDWNKCMRYSLYGSLFSAPALYSWIKLTSVVWPQSTFRIAVLKAVTEQLVFEPIYICTFFIVMSMWEGKSFGKAKDEMLIKFWPTYIVSSCFWPIFQTVNFAYVPERNRVVAISCASLGWVTFLAYIKHLQIKHKEDPHTKQ